MPEQVVKRQPSPRLEASEPIQRCGWPACRAACCVYGTWVSEAELLQLIERAAEIRPHLPEASQEKDLWFGEETEQDALRRDTVWHTRVVDDPDHYGGSACVFLRRDYKCGLQVAAEAQGLPGWQFKPYYCVLHPLDLDDQGRLTLDEIHLMVSEPASCIRSAPAPISLSDLFAEELAFLSE